MLLQAVGDGHKHLVYTFVFDQTPKQRTGFARVIVAQELPHLLDGDLTGEVDLGILQQEPGKLLHGTSAGESLPTPPRL